MNRVMLFGSQVLVLTVLFSVTLNRADDGSVTAGGVLESFIVSVCGVAFSGLILFKLIPALRRRRATEL